MPFFQPYGAVVFQATNRVEFTGEIVAVDVHVELETPSVCMDYTVTKTLTTN